MNSVKTIIDQSRFKGYVSTCHEHIDRKIRLMVKHTVWHPALNQVGVVTRTIYQKANENR